MNIYITIYLIVVRQLIRILITMLGFIYRRLFLMSLFMCLGVRLSCVTLRRVSEVFGGITMG